MKKLFPIILALSLVSPTAFAATDVFTSSSTWTAPRNVIGVQVNAWAGGGGGGTFSVTPPGGGAGGGFAGLNSFPVIPGVSYSVSVGIGGGTQATGTDSWFNSTGTVLAKGGPPGSATASAGGTAAPTSTEIGDVLHKGGNGGTGAAGTNGGGGGGAGTLNDGSNGVGGASTCAGGAGGSVGGGSGQGCSNNPASPSANGGGGQGGTGNGANGEVDVIYTPNTPLVAVTGVTVRGGVTIR